MDTLVETNCTTNVAARVAGEDIKSGDYITALTEMYEFPSFLWCGSDCNLAAEEPIKMVLRAGDAGQPNKVFAVCLPFVYGKRVGGGIEIFDVRKHQIVRLDREIGRTVWKRLRKSLKKRSFLHA